MATFKLEKGSSFSIEKAISRIRLGIGWDAAKPGEPKRDIDAHAFACVYVNGAPKFYNEGSHAVSYANADLKRNPDKSFQTSDGSMHHSGDNQSGDGDGDDERITIDLARLPEDIKEIFLFVTIHDAIARGQHFGMVENSQVSVYNDDTGEKIASYSLRNEFDGLISLQVGSMVKTNGKWAFIAKEEGAKDAGLAELWGNLA